MPAVKAQISPAVSEMSPEELNPDQTLSLPADDKHPFPHDISPSVALVPYFAELICSEGISEKVFALRFDALKMLQGLIHHYDERGYSDTLLNGIAEKKGAMIMSASSKTEMDKILKPKAPHFDGVRFVADRYLLPEEELICWSEASLRAPLNEYAFRRYMELFCRMFPEESEALHIACFSPANGDTISINGVEYRVSDLSFSDLSVHYFTGVAVRKLGDQHSKSSGYRNGVMTGIGDLEFPVWETLVRDLIHRSGEDELLNSLIAWLEGTPWLHTKRDKELYALELHAGRIFDNPDWVDYAAFNRQYRPDKLQGDECSHESGKENP